MRKVPIDISTAYIYREGAVVNQQPNLDDPQQPLNPNTPDVPKAFVDLVDTPSSYAGEGGKVVAVKSDASGLEFVNAGAGGSDSNAVHYNADDGKNATEKQRARTNIGSTSGIPQVINITTASTIEVSSRTSNNIIFTGTGPITLNAVQKGEDGEDISIFNYTTNPITINPLTGTVGDRFGIGSVKQIQPNFFLTFKYKETGTAASAWHSEEQLYRFGISTFTNTSGSNIVVINNLNSGSNGFINQLSGVNTFVISGNGATQISNTLTVLGRCILGNGTPGNGGVQVRNNNSGVTPLAILSVNGTILSQFVNGSTTAGGQLRFSNRSADSNDAIRRDELHLNYNQAVGGTGVIDNLAINISTKLVLLSGATELTGVVPVDTTLGRMVRIYANGNNIIIRNESTGSTASNRFSIGADFTILDGFYKDFIYIASRWRTSM